MATQDDEPFLWEMLYYAVHVDEDGKYLLKLQKGKVLRST
jgi:hypothetical protein